MKTRTKQVPKIRIPYDRIRVFAKNDLPSLTEQSHKDACDLKFIMRRFTQTGELPPSREREILYGDAPDQEHDLHTQLSTLAKAKSAFEELPENVREKFKNVYEYFEAINDPSSIDLLTEIGLIEPEKPEPSEQPPEPSASGDGEKNE